MQNCLRNSIQMPHRFTEEEVLGAHDDSWHIEKLNLLCDQIFEVLDNCSGVLEYELRPKYTP